MNVEICKKCEFMKDKHYYLEFLPCNGIGKNDRFTPCWMCDDDTMFNDPICQCKPVHEKHISFNQIEVDDDCPYYLEHQIYDWNIKNES